MAAAALGSDQPWAWSCESPTLSRFAAIWLYEPRATADQVALLLNAHNVLLINLYVLKTTLAPSILVWLLAPCHGLLNRSLWP
jgi:hypothetical protein